MREIKFRKWSKNTEGKFRMKDVFDYDEMSKNPKYWDAIYMQYTGLKANGKEIYEGDILRANDEVGVVEWDNYRWFISWKKYENGHPDLQLGRYNTDLEIIGNIYENPELLKVKKG